MEDVLEAFIPQRYSVDSVLGRGGSGVIFAAYDREQQRRVAIKVLHCSSPDAGGRLLREARICSRLQNEHIVQVFDTEFLPNGVPFLVMERLLGEGLDALIRRGPLDLEKAKRYFLQTCNAVGQAHDAGIIHRDLKPANLFVAETSNGLSIKVLDFGLAKLQHDCVSPDTLTATVSGTVVGTPAYMSPEQLLGDRALDARADVWALGIILFEMLTGERPFVGDSLPAIAIAIATARPRDPLSLRPELPPTLVTTIRDCLAKAPQDRPPSVKAVVEGLHGHQPAKAYRRDVPRRRSKALAAHPAIRASAVRDTLKFLDRFEPESTRRVLEQVPSASREIIEGSSRSSWISIEHDHWLVDAMVDLFGTERAIQCWRDAVVHLVERPLLRNFVSGTFAVFGRSPASVVRLFAKGWPIIYQDLCEPSLIATVDGQPTLRFENIAPEVRCFKNYLHSWHGACQGFAELSHVMGSVRFEVAPDFAWAQAKFFWDETVVPAVQTACGGTH